MNPPLLDDFRRRLAGHTLELVQAGRVTAYYLRLPNGGRLMARLLVFSPEGIALLGDLTPTHPGTVCFGYGLDWFVRFPRLEPDYLASKFLAKKWVPELAAERLRDRVYMGTDTRKPRTAAGGAVVLVDEDDDDAAVAAADQQQSKFNALARRVHELMQHELYEALDDAGHDLSDGVPGWGYEPGEVAWLVAIQERFAALYLAAGAGRPAGLRARLAAAAEEVRHAWAWYRRGCGTAAAHCLWVAFVWVRSGRWPTATEYRRRAAGGAT